MLFFDYMLYYFVCLGWFKLGNWAFKDNKPLETFEFYGVGVASLLFYMYMYLEHGLFMMDTFV